MDYKRALIEPAPLPSLAPPSALKAAPRTVLPEITQDPATCHFFKLPSELRLKFYNTVYEGRREAITLTLNGNMPSCDWYTSWYAEVPIIVRERTPHHLSSLSRTCKTFYREASPELYKNIDVKMWFSRVYCLCDYICPGEEWSMAQEFRKRAKIRSDLSPNQRYKRAGD